MTVEEAGEGQPPPRPPPPPPELSHLVGELPSNVSPLGLLASGMMRFGVPIAAAFDSVVFEYFGQDVTADNHGEGLDYVLLEHDARCIIQDGPTCGATAARIAFECACLGALRLEVCRKSAQEHEQSSGHNARHGCPVPINFGDGRVSHCRDMDEVNCFLDDMIVEVAKKRGLTEFGEFFSACDLCSAFEEVLTLVKPTFICTAQPLLVRDWTVHGLVTDMLTARSVYVIPYDASSGSGDVLVGVKGAAAHWCAVIGLILPSAYDSDDTLAWWEDGSDARLALPPKEGSSPWDNLQSVMVRIMRPRYQPGKEIDCSAASQPFTSIGATSGIYAVLLQGRSKRRTVVPLETLHASCHGLRQYKKVIHVDGVEHSIDEFIGPGRLAGMAMKLSW